QAHQDLPFEQLVEAVNPARSLAHSPLFQTMLVWQNTPQGELNLSGLDIEFVTPDQVTAKFDLLLSMEENGPLIDGCVEYASAMFDHATVARWIEHWQVLLQAMARDETQAIERLPLLTAPQRQQVLIDWNATQADYPRAQCIHELIEAQVQRSPESLAVTHGTTNLTYAELNAQANRLAHHLIELGVTADERVAIYLPRSADMVVALLAVLKAGGAYVPIDPAYPVERIAYMLEDAAPRVLITRTFWGKNSTPVPSSLHVVLLDEVPSREDQPSHNPQARVTPPHLAYVIYTSGSTGRPKGVCMPHGPLVNLIAWQIGNEGQSPRRTLQYAALGFDVSFQEIFSTLCIGGELILIDDADRLDFLALSNLIQEQRIERLFLPYVALRELCAQLLHAGDEDDLRSLREIVTAGEQLVITPEMKSLFSQRLAHVRLHNHYGPTETHVSCAFELPADVRHWTRLPPIGRPISNARVYVLDTHGQPVPIGVAGEIHVAGQSVARGYLNNVELTTQRFLHDSFVRPSAQEPEPRMYRTGDRGRWRADGGLEYQGRSDRQMKIRGFRVEPGEIEAQLASCPGIRQAVVILRDEDAGHRRLVAYFTVVDDEVGEGLEPGVLRGYLEVRVPEYMVPAAYVRLESFPLSPNGKLDRAALPAPDSSAHSHRIHEPPEGEIEQIVADIWMGLLNIDRVGRDDHFFELGGHSLLAVQLVSRIKDRLMIDVAVQDIFAEPRLRAIASLILQRIDDKLSELIGREGALSDDLDEYTTYIN
ncbi:MAG: amino acid adenylation domain-containing protein, partial [Burkholderiales bacterium]|nr:amino acid adenylation domain-containing protein [Burkholderiales bacterium]